MKNKITLSQLCSICWQIMLASSIGIISYISINGAKQDAWASIVISAVLGIIPLFSYLYLLNYKKSKNFFELNNYLFGNKIGRFISSLSTVPILIYIIIYFYNMCNFITLNYLTNTPNLFISLIFLIPIMYLISQDLQVIARCLFIIFGFAIILHFATLIGLINQIDINNLKPILTSDFNNIFSSCLKIIPFTVFPNILLLSVRKKDITNSKNLNKCIFIIYLLVFVVILSIVFFVISVLGVKLSALYEFPEFQVLKHISIARFIERMETTLSIHWVLYVISSIVFCLYFIKQYIKYTYKIKKDKTLNISIIVIATILLILSNLIFKNVVIANYIISNIIPLVLYIINLGTIILILIKIKIKKYYS